MKSLFICLHFHVHIQWELTLTCISQLRSADVFLQESQFLVYGNGKDKPPTGLMFDKQQIKGLYFNQTPSKVSTLCSTIMQPEPVKRCIVSSIVMPACMSS